MRNPRNTIVASIGSAPGAAKVRELFTQIAERDFGSNPSRLLADIAREMVMSMRVEDAETAEKLGLFRESIMGPNICQAVVQSYARKAKKIRDQYFAASSVATSAPKTK